MKKNKIGLLYIIPFLLSGCGINSNNQVPDYGDKFVLTNFSASNSTRRRGSSSVIVNVEDTHTLTITFNNPKEYVIKSIVLNDILFTFEDFLEGSTTSKIIIAVPVVLEEQNMEYVITKVTYIDEEGEECELELDESNATELNIQYKDYDPKGTGDVTIHTCFGNSTAYALERAIHKVRDSGLYGYKPNIEIIKYQGYDHLLDVYNKANFTEDLYGNGAHIFILPSLKLAQLNDGVSFQDFSNLIAEDTLNKINPIFLDEGYSLTGSRYAAIPFLFSRGVAYAYKDEMKAAFGDNHDNVFLDSLENICEKSNILKNTNKMFKAGIGTARFSDYIAESIYNFTNPLSYKDKDGFIHSNLLDELFQNELKELLQKTINTITDGHPIMMREMGDGYSPYYFADKEIGASFASSGEAKYHSVDGKLDSNVELLPYSYNSDGNETVSTIFIVGLSTSKENDRKNMALLIEQFLNFDTFLNICHEWTALPCIEGLESSPIFSELLEDNDNLAILYEMNKNFPLTRGKISYKKYSPVDDFFRGHTEYLLNRALYYGVNHAVDLLVESYLKSFDYTA